MGQEMHSVKTNKQITIHSGILGLSKDQADSRIHYLKKAGKFFEITSAVQFKKGETFDIQSISKELEVAVEIHKRKDRNATHASQ